MEREITTVCLLAFVMHCLFLHFGQQKSMNKFGNNLLRIQVSASANLPTSHFTSSQLQSLLIYTNSADSSPVQKISAIFLAVSALFTRETKTVRNFLTSLWRPRPFRSHCMQISYSDMTWPSPEHDTNTALLMTVKVKKGTEKFTEPPILIRQMFGFCKPQILSSQKYKWLYSVPRQLSQNLSLKNPPTTF